MKITRFKDYNGNTIIVDSHKHSVTDTVANGSTAIVSTTQDGFMSKTIKTNLDNMNTKVAAAKTKIKDVVFIYPSITLLTGSEFLSALTTVGPNATSVVFTTTAVPADKKDTARVVSTTTSEAKAYMYLTGTTVYVCPENKNFTMYMNENSSNMFSGRTNITSIDLSGVNTSRMTNTNAMFKNCTKLTCTILIHNAFVKNYSEMFKGCSTATGSKVTVNYKSAGKTTATNMVATKDSTSNVGLGSLIA